LTVGISVLTGKDVCNQNGTACDPEPGASISPGNEFDLAW
jgi:hypothetical protein